MILSVIDRIYKFFEYKFLPNKQLNGSKLPKWVGVSKERFNEILGTVTEAKNYGFITNVDGREITLDNAESLLKDRVSKKMNRNEFKRECNNNVDDVKAIMQKPVLTRSQKKMADILSLLAEFPKFKDKKLDEQPDNTDMPESESEESVEEKSIGLKIPTPNQMLSRLPFLQPN